MDLFRLSFQTKPDAGDGGLDFLRPDAYTAKQLQAEIADLIKHPDNAHVVSVEIRRISHVAPLALAPLDLMGSNAYAGFEFHIFEAAEAARCVTTSSAPEAAQLLVECLITPAVWMFTLEW